MSRYPTLLNSNTFIQLPTDTIDEDEDVSIENIHKLISSGSSPIVYLKVASIVKKLLLSLKGAMLSLDEILKIWELRIMCLMYITNRKIEISDGAQVFKIQSIKYIKNEVDILIPELYKINKLRKQHDLNYNAKQRQVEQFPREVSNVFKFLLLRIRYGSSLMLVNEYYQHIWRTQEKTELQLNKLSFSIISVLIAKQEFLTLINLANSILINLKESEGQYFDKLILIKTLSQLIRIHKEHLQLPMDIILLEFCKMSNHDPLKSLNQILNQVEAVYNDPDSSVLTNESIYNMTLIEPNFEILQKQVQNLEITGRIMCSLCALFEIEMLEEEINEEINPSVIDSLKILRGEWTANVTKYYGLE